MAGMDTGVDFNKRALVPKPGNLPYSAFPVARLPISREIDVFDVSKTAISDSRTDGTAVMAFTFNHLGLFCRLTD